MILARNTPAAAVARLARKLHEKRERTILLIEGDLVAETQVGFSWRDAAQALWEGQQVHPVRVIDANFDALEMTDQSAAMAMYLAERTRVEQRSPAHLEAFFAFYGVEGFDERASRRRDPNLEHRLNGRQLGIVR